MTQIFARGRQGKTTLLATSTIAMTVSALSAVMAPAAIAYAPSYRSCMDGLLELDIAAGVAATACASALSPEEVGDCVDTLTAADLVSAPDAVASCRRVRRPTEMADCVVDISATVALVDPLAALDHCQRALLPERYERCVTEIDEVTDFTADDLLMVCISAGDRPRDLAPSFIPRIQVEPLLLLPGDGM